jgi:hypothetical protein
MIIYGKHFHWKNDHLRWEMSGEMIIYAGKWQGKWSFTLENDGKWLFMSGRMIIYQPGKWSFMSLPLGTGSGYFPSDQKMRNHRNNHFVKSNIPRMQKNYGFPLVLIGFRGDVKIHFSNLSTFRRGAMGTCHFIKINHFTVVHFLVARKISWAGSEGEGHKWSFSGLVNDHSSRHK